MLLTLMSSVIRVCIICTDLSRFRIRNSKFLIWHREGVAKKKEKPNPSKPPTKPLDLSTVALGCPWGLPGIYNTRSRA